MNSLNELVENLSLDLGIEVTIVATELLSQEASVYWFISYIPVLAADNEITKKYDENVILVRTKKLVKGVVVHHSESSKVAKRKVEKALKELRKDILKAKMTIESSGLSWHALVKYVNDVVLRRKATYLVCKASDFKKRDIKGCLL